MKNIDLGQIVNTIANVGVIVGIAFLVYEIRQNNELLELEAYRAFNDRALSNNDLMLNNQKLIEIALTDPIAMTEEQAYLQSLMAIRTFLIWEEQYELVRAGRFEAEEVIPSWRIIYWTPQISFGMPSHWERYKPRARSDFVEFVEVNVIAPGPLE